MINKNKNENIILILLFRNSLVKSIVTMIITIMLVKKLKQEMVKILGNKNSS